MLGAGALAIVVEGSLAAVWGRRVSRRAREVSRRTEAELALVNRDLEHVRAAMAETAVLWQPYGRLLRWLRHPLAVALLRSYSRRRAALR